MRIGSFHGDPPAIEFSPFSWKGRTESQGTPDAHRHLEVELEKFGAKFNRDNFKLVDCRSNNQMLSIDDPKIGKLSGGSDLAIVPFDTHPDSFSQLASVLFELKTDKTESLDSHVPQGKLELLAVRALSYQPDVLVVVTNLVTGAIVLQFEYNKTYGSFTVVQTPCSLPEMATLVCKCLSNDVPDVAFRPSVSNPRDEAVVAFKKTKTSNDQGIMMEHFMEMAADPDTTPEERYHLLRQLFQSSDVEKMPTMLTLPFPMSSSMYT